MVPTYVGIFLLAAATFAFEISLTRLFSVAQFYHFAFMAVSLALLGFGASGSALTVWPRLARGQWQRRLAMLSAACGLSIPAAYLVTNLLPFDSYSIAWDARQVGYLLLYYAALLVPFILSGLATAIPLAAIPSRANRIYGASLVGSAAGCLVALLALPRLGGPGTIAGAGLLGCLAAAAFACKRDAALHTPDHRRWTTYLVFMLGTVALAWLALTSPPFFEIRLSPYKGLSQALRYPGARIIYSQWNAYSRVDLVESPGVRQLPGLSYTFEEMPPPQLGLAVDADNLTPVLVVTDPADDLGFADYLPSAAAYRLRTGARALVLQPGGGLDVWAALAGGASAVTVVESNPLLLDAVRSGIAPPAINVYDDHRVRVVSDLGRSYLRRSEEQFDVVHLSLTQPYRPVTCGAYSLAEDYQHTSEAFGDYLDHLGEDGLLVVTRWLQTPPSESVRTLALIVEALIARGVDDPMDRVIALRGVQTGTFLVGQRGFTRAEMEAVRNFCADRRFDLVVGPGVTDEEVNRYNVLPEPYYAKAYKQLLAAEEPRVFYAGYPYAVSPPTDDHPFFHHFFRWQQTPEVLGSLGKTWQPFGGSGVFVLLALLALALSASALLIAGPLLIRRSRSAVDEPKKVTAKLRRRFSRSGLGPRSRGLRLRVLLYFGLLGLAYMFVEIPLMQRFILYLGQPVHAMAVVLSALLLFSGLGSITSSRLSHRWSLSLLAAAIILYPTLLSILFSLTLRLPLPSRFVLTVLVLAPLGVLMGMPFPQGLSLLSRQSPSLIPWGWAVNGCASVIGSILAALGALSWGFSLVLVAGALSYAAALLCAWSLKKRLVPA